MLQDFLISSPGVNEFPTINKTPAIAKIIEVNVTADIFSFRKKYPNIARNKICKRYYEICICYCRIIHCKNITTKTKR